MSGLWCTSERSAMESSVVAIAFVTQKAVGSSEEATKTLGRGVAHETGSDVIVERKFEVKVQLGSLGSAAHPSAAASTN
ncbi:unnamed protein product, partial [Musa hybrid cultivar]